MVGFSRVDRHHTLGNILLGVLINIAMLNSNVFASSFLEEKEALSQKLNWEASQIEALQLQKEKESASLQKFFASYNAKEDVLKRMSFFDILRCQRMTGIYKRELTQEAHKSLYSWVKALNRRPDWNRVSDLQGGILAILSGFSKESKGNLHTYDEAYCLMKGWRSQLLRDAEKSPLKEERIALRRISNILLDSRNVRRLLKGQAF